LTSNFAQSKIKIPRRDGQIIRRLRRFDNGDASRRQVSAWFASTAGDAYFEFVYFPGIAEGFHSIKGDPQALIERFLARRREKRKKSISPR
jgi:hypothetical protein